MKPTSSIRPGIVLVAARGVRFSLGVVCCLCVLVATERRALAYVDPGSGLLALQSIASMAAAAAYFLRRKIAVLFRREEKKPAGRVTVPVVASTIAARGEKSRSAA
jgi:hypothetical protein